MWSCGSEVSLASTACMRFQSTWCHSSQNTGWCHMGWAVRMQDSGCSTFISEPLLCMPFAYIPSAALWLWKQWSQQTAHKGTLAILTGLKLRVYDRLMWKCGANSNYRLRNSNLIFLGFAFGANNHQHPDEWFATTSLAFPCHLRNTHGTNYCVLTQSFFGTSGFLQKTPCLAFAGTMSASKLEKTVVNLERRLREVHVKGMLFKCSRLGPWPLATLAFTSFIKMNCSRFFLVVFKCFKTALNSKIT